MNSLLWAREKKRGEEEEEARRKKAEKSLSIHRQRNRPGVLMKPMIKFTTHRNRAQCNQWMYFLLFFSSLCLCFRYPSWCPVKVFKGNSPLSGDTINCAWESDFIYTTQSSSADTAESWESERSDSESQATNKNLWLNNNTVVSEWVSGWMSE